MRDAKTGWMQGLVTHTTFTHWTRYFAWDSLHPRSGVKDAGMAVNNEEALDVYVADEDRPSPANPSSVPSLSSF